MSSSFRPVRLLLRRVTRLGGRKEAECPPKRPFKQNNQINKRPVNIAKRGPPRQPFTRRSYWARRNAAILFQFQLTGQMRLHYHYKTGQRSNDLIYPLVIRINDQQKYKKKQFFKIKLLFRYNFAKNELRQLFIQLASKKMFILRPSLK